ncbi:phage tail assembly protein [Paenibacillus lutrae]|uniref:Phage tail assembly protein n=1 Tax=Paenibacillus lutrae TaxID=2078573 RepID=A0A7X3K147_9BACL|nr:phage tail assembly protein [Paenibacillus lutrae]MVP01914.1 phage tail assembly protein [Paenibacillus lutrae]
MAFKTDYEFELPRGFVDSSGNIHKKGVMRLATAADEILPMRDPRVQANPQYLMVILLTRVITRLGELPNIDAKVIENLFTSDLAFLQDFYKRINEGEDPVLTATCPNCKHEFIVPISVGYKVEG